MSAGSEKVDTQSRSTAAEPANDDWSGIWKATVHRVDLCVAEPASRPILILGPRGSGKESIAHRLAGSGPFTAINCALLGGDSSAVQSALFGHTKGAFTGAYAGRTSPLSLEGTVFLDEIHALPVDARPMLLRAIQSRCFRPLGADIGTKESEVKARLVFASNRTDSALRLELPPDLYDRIAVVVVRLPPLSSRGIDAERIAEDFVRRSFDKWSLTKSARVLIGATPYPGGVRTLQSWLINAKLEAAQEGQRIDLRDLIRSAPEECRRRESLGPPPSSAAESLVERLLRSLPDTHLGSVAPRAPLRVRAIAEAWGVDAAAVGRALRRAEEVGWIALERTKRGESGVPYRLTDTGRGRAAELKLWFSSELGADPLPPLGNTGIVA